MDDIYFSDKKKKNDELNENSSRDKFVGADYYDESFDLKFRKKGNAQAFSSNKNKNKNFQVNIPESELEASAEIRPEDRTPKGRAVSRIPEGDESDAVFSYGTAPVSEQDFIPEANSYYAPQQRQNVSHQMNKNGYNMQNHQHTNSPQNRTPRGSRVSGANSQQSTPRHYSQPMHAKQPTNNTRKKQGGSSAKKVIAGFMCLLIILLSALGVFAYSCMGSLTYDKSIVPNQYISESELYSSPSVRNILIIGSDARGDVDGQRSDTMILFSIDSKNGQIKLTSFLRDSYVYIPSKGYKTKLNAAFSYGGTQLVMDTIEYNFGVNIDNYVMVSFDAFKQIVDLMGGVTVEGVTAKEAQYMNNVVKIPSVKQGTNKMNGNTALWYCRIRKLDSDFYRTQRQRKVISSVINKAKKTNPITLANMCKEVLPYISTDINKGELVSLAVGAVFSFLRYDMAQQQIPAEGTWSSQRINGSAVIAMDIEQNKNILRSFLEEKYVEPEETDK